MTQQNYQVSHAVERASMGGAPLSSERAEPEESDARGTVQVAT